MDASAAPWRVLEAEAAQAEPGSGPEGEPPRGRRSVPLAPVAAFAVAGALAIGAFVIAAGGSDPTVAVGGDRPTTTEASPRAAGSGRLLNSPAAGGQLLVDVQGAVAHPGVVRLPSGSRVGDAIAAAGGYSRRVASDRVSQRLNLAAVVRDGDQILVPSRDDGAAGGAGTAGGGGAASSQQVTGGGSAAAGPIDLNRATEAELDSLPGIGPVTAAKIVAARAEQPFSSVDDLRTRKLVGPSTFEKIRALVVVG